MKFLVGKKAFIIHVRGLVFFDQRIVQSNACADRNLFFRYKRMQIACMPRGIVVKVKLFFIVSTIDQNDGSMNDGSRTISINQDQSLDA